MDITLIDPVVGPIVEIASPQNNSDYESHVTVTGKVVNQIAGPLTASEVKSLEYAIANLSIAKTTVPFDVNSGNFSFSFSAEGYSQNLSVELIATDKNDRESIKTLTLLGSSTGPDLSISTPLDRSYYKSTVEVVGSVSSKDWHPDTGLPATSELASLQYRVAARQEQLLYDINIDETDETYLNLQTGDYRFTIDTVGLSGTAALLIIAKDKNGRESTASIDLIGYPAGPAVAITSPLDKSYYQSTIAVSGSVTDQDWDVDAGVLPTSELAKLTYRVGVRSEVVLYDIAVDPADETSITLSTGDFTFIAETVIDNIALIGTVSVQITATDKNGRQTTASIDLTDYGIGPEIAITKPSQNSSYASTVRVEGSVEDRGINGFSVSEVKSVSYDVPSLSIANLTADMDDLGNADFFLDPASGEFWFEFSAAGFNQNFSIIVRAKDRSLRASSYTISLIGDSIGPSVSITSPPDKSYYKSTISIEGIVKDRNWQQGDIDLPTAELEWLKYRVAARQEQTLYDINIDASDETYLALQTDEYTFTVDAIGLVGAVALQVTAQDKNGRQTRTSIDLSDYPIGPDLGISTPIDKS